MNESTCACLKSNRTNIKDEVATSAKCFKPTCQQFLICHAFNTQPNSLSRVFASCLHPKLRSFSFICQAMSYSYAEDYVL